MGRESWILLVLSLYVTSCYVMLHQRKKFFVLIQMQFSIEVRPIFFFFCRCFSYTISEAHVAYSDSAQRSTLSQNLDSRFLLKSKHICLSLQLSLKHFSRYWSISGVNDSRKVAPPGNFLSISCQIYAIASPLGEFPRQLRTLASCMTKSEARIGVRTYSERGALEKAFHVRTLTLICGLHSKENKHEMEIKKRLIFHKSG